MGLGACPAGIAEPDTNSCLRARPPTEGNMSVSVQNDTSREGKPAAWTVTARAVSMAMEVVPHVNGDIYRASRTAAAAETGQSDKELLVLQ